MSKVITKESLRLVNARSVEFNGREGSPIKYVSAKLMDIDNAVIFEVTSVVPLESLKALEGEDIKCEFDILQGEKGKPKLRLSAVKAS